MKERKSKKKQSRDTCGEGRRGLRLKPHKKNNFAVGEEIGEGGREAAFKQIYLFFYRNERKKIPPTL